MADRQSEDKLSRSSPVAPTADSAQPAATVLAQAAAVVSVEMAETVPAMMTMATSAPGHVPSSSSSVSLNNTLPLNITAPSSSSSLSLVSQPSMILAERPFLRQCDITNFVSNLLMDNLESGHSDKSLASLSTRLHAIGSATVAAEMANALRLDIIIRYLPTLAKLAEFLSLLEPEYALAILQMPVIRNQFATLLQLATLPQQESASVSMPSVVISFMLGLNDKDSDVLPAVVSLYREQPWCQPITCFDIYSYSSLETIRRIIHVFDIVPTWSDLIKIINEYRSSAFHYNRSFELYNIIKDKSAPNDIIIKDIVLAYLSRVKDGHRQVMINSTLAKILESAINNKFIGYQDVIDILNTINKGRATSIILLFPKDFMAKLLEDESSIRSDGGKKKLSCSTESPFNLMGYIFFLERIKIRAVNNILEDFFIKRRYANNNSFKPVVDQISVEVKALDVLTGLPQDIIAMIFACFHESHTHKYKRFIGYKIPECDRGYFFKSMEAILNNLTDAALLIISHLLRGTLALMQIVMSYQSISAPMLEFIKNNANHIADLQNIAYISRQVKELPSSYEYVHRIKELMIHLSDSKLTSLLTSHFVFVKKVTLWSLYVDGPNSRLRFSEAHLDKLTNNYDDILSPYYDSWRDVFVQHKPFMLLFFMLSVLTYQDERELTSMGVAQNRASLARLMNLADKSIQNQRHLHGFLMLFPWSHWPTIVNLLRGHINKLKTQGKTFDEFLTLANHEGMPPRVRFLCMHLDRIINPADDKVIAITDETAYERVKQELIATVFAAKRKGKPLTPSQLCLEMLGGLSATMGTALSLFVDNPVAKIRQEIIKQIEAMKCEASMFTLLDMMHDYQVKLAQLAVSGGQSLERYNMYLIMELLIVYFNQESRKELVDILSIHEKPGPNLDLTLSMSEPDPVDVPAHAIPTSSSSSSSSSSTGSILGLSSSIFSIGKYLPWRGDDKDVGCSEVGPFRVRESLVRLDIDERGASGRFWNDLLSVQLDSSSDDEELTLLSVGESRGDLPSAQLGSGSDDESTLTLH